MVPTESSPLPMMNGTRVESTARHVNLGKRCCDSAVGPEGPSTGRTLQPSSRTGRSNRTTISCRPESTESDPFAMDSETILRSEEHTSELQSHSDIVCRLLLEKKNTTTLR